MIGTAWRGEIASLNLREAVAAHCEWLDGS